MAVIIPADVYFQKTKIKTLECTVPVLESTAVYKGNSRLHKMRYRVEWFYRDWGAYANKSWSMEIL